jgi:hypothetical protein
MAAPQSTFDPFAIEKLLAPTGDIVKPNISNDGLKFQVPQVGYGNIDFPYSYSGVKQTTSPVASEISRLFNSAGTERFMGSPITYNADEINTARYVSSPDYYKLGISLTGDNEERYGQNQSWSEVLSNGFSGMGKLAYNGFTDGWKGWGRMTDALIHWDWDRLHGDAQSMLKLDDSLKDIMNSNPIYATKEGTDTFWNRQTFGNFLQQAGFTVGAGAQMLSEQLLTKAIEAALVISGVGAPGAAAIETAADVKLAANIGRVARMFQKSKEFYDAAKNFKALKKLGDIWKNEAVLKNFFSSVGQKIPGVDIAMDIGKTYEAGKLAGLSGTKLAGDIAKVGVSGLKRTLSEANFAFTEARMEAAGTFGDLYNQMQDDYFNNKGVYATDEQLQKMQNVAMQAADKNFNFNSAVLAVSNRIMFDNVFKNSKATSRILSQFGEDLGEKGFKVLGKINGRTTSQYYTGGILSNYKTIAADFGTRKARTVLAKSIMKPALKFEVTEGIQELLQEGSNEYYKDYYLNSYKASFDPNTTVSEEESLDRAIKSQMNMQGLKTFASGALTGMIIHGPTVLTQKGLKKIGETVSDKYKTAGLTEEQKAEYFKNKKEFEDKLKNYYNEFNIIAKDPSKFFSESIKNFNVQKEGASALDEAAKLGDKFAYENIRTDMLHSMVSQAVRNDTHEALIDTLREYGKNMSKEEFEQAFVGLDYTSENKKSAQDYTDKVANAVESYAKTYNKLQEKYGAISNPNRYKFGTKEYNKEIYKKQALNNMIDVLAGNEFKATNAIDRSRELFSKASSHKTLGSSLASAYNILGSDANIEKEIKTLEIEISTKKEQLKSEGISDESKKDLRNEIELKEKQKQAITDWLNNKDELIDEIKVSKSYEAFKSYLELKNKEFGKESVININEVEDLFVDFNDYIKLNNKFQQHVDAVNMLSNPEYFNQVYERMIVGSQLAYYQMLYDSAQEQIKAGLVKSDEHFIVEANGMYGVFTPTGNVVFIVDDLDKAREIKEESDKLIYKGEEEIVIQEETKKEEIKKEKKEEETKKEGDLKINGRPITIITAENNIIYYKFNDDIDGEIYSFLKKEDGKFYDAETNEQITVTRVVQKEKPAPVSTDAKADIEKEKSIITDSEFKELTRLANFFLENPKEPTVAGSVVTKYPALFKALTDIERRRQEELKNKYGNNLELISSKNETVIQRNGIWGLDKKDYKPQQVPTKEIFEEFDKINAKYDAELAALEGGKEITTTEEEFVVEDINQVFTGTKKTLDDISKNSDVKFQEGFKQVAPALSLAQRTHNYNVVEVSPNVLRYERSDVNNSYVFYIATPEFLPGKSVYFKVIEPDVNYDQANIGIYTLINGKETLIGNVHTPDWISKKIGKTYVNIVIPENERDMDNPPTLVNQLKINRAFRKLMLDNHAKNPNFVLSGNIEDKSMGIIVTVNSAGLLKDRINPKVSEGGVENRHGVFGIVRNGFIEVDKGQQISPNKLAEINYDFSQYEGYTLLMVPTPTGVYFPTFIKLPNVARQQSEFILKAVSVFRGNEENNDLVDKVYKAVGSEYIPGQKPNMVILKKYINHYITNLDSKALSKTGSGSDLSENVARIDIFDDGNIKLQSKLNDQYVNVVIRSDKDAPSNILEHMDGLLTSIRYTDTKNDSLKGINSTKKINILGVENGKLISNNITYNQYIMNGAKTNLEKGIESNNNNDDWVYFANPVIKYTYGNPVSDPVEEIIEKKPEVTKEQLNTPVDLDKAAKMLAFLSKNGVSNETIEEQKDDCNISKYT